MAAASQGTSQFTASECCRYTTLMDVNKKMGGGGGGKEGLLGKTESCSHSFVVASV